jgi:hypothetical protein
MSIFKGIRPVNGTYPTGECCSYGVGDECKYTSTAGTECLSPEMDDRSKIAHSPGLESKWVIHLGLFPKTPDCI